MRTYIGIDPGSKGFVSVRLGAGGYSFLSLYDIGIGDIYSFLRSVYDVSGGDVVCCLEDVHALRGSSAGSTFSFGWCKGMLEGVLVGCGIGYVMVLPRVWQGSLWCSGDKEYVSRGGKRVLDVKGTSINCCRRLFPGIDLRRSERCKVVDDNKCDSLLLCEYGRRNNF